MGDRQDAASVAEHRFTKRGGKRGVTGAVDRGGCFVEEQHDRFMDDSAREGEQLLLPC